jgi:hypothetical protein
MRKVHLFCLLFVPAFALTACGGLNDGTESSSTVLTYYVEPKLERYNSVKFASAFDDTQFVITDSSSLKQIPVTSDMVTGFNSSQNSFDKDLTAKVAYQKMSLDLVYQISSTYSVDGAYDLKLSSDQAIEISRIYPSGKTLSTYTVPDTISALPAPLNTWPVTTFSDTTFTDALTTFHLGKNQTSLDSLLGNFTQIIPAENGALKYDNGFLIDGINHKLLGMSADLSGEVSIPSGVTSLASYSFATPNSKITKLTIPSTVKLGLSFYGAVALTGLTAFGVESGNTHLQADQNGTLYVISNGGTLAAAVPMGKSYTVASPLVLENTSKSSPLDFLYQCTNVKAVTLSDTATYFSVSSYDLPSIERLTLPGTTAVVKPSAGSLAHFSTTCVFKVPSSLLADYQASDDWSSVKDRISAIA